MIEVSVNTLGLEQKVLRLATYTHKSVGDVLRQEGRLLAIQLARYTQPFGFDDKAKEQGENAIAGDLVGTRKTGKAASTQGSGYGGVFEVIPDDLMAAAVQRPDGTTKLFAKKDGTVYGADTTKVLSNPSMSQLAAIHQAARRPSDGNVSQAGYATRDIGRWKFIDKFVIAKSVFHKYLAFVFPKVGIGKSGWAGCAKILGGTRGIPGWVTRHLKNFNFGEVDDRTKQETPVLILRNKVNYTSQVLSESGQRGAIRDCEIRLKARIKAALEHGVKDA